MTSTRKVKSSTTVTSTTTTTSKRRSTLNYSGSGNSKTSPNKRSKLDVVFEKPLEPIYTHRGIAMTWGIGGMGQLGYDTDSRRMPTIIPSLREKEIVQVESGAMHTMFLTPDGEVYACGVEDDGCLSRGNREDENDYDNEYSDDEEAPRLVKDLAGKKVIQLGCGDSFTVALDDEGLVHQCGTFRDSRGTYGMTTKEIKLYRFTEVLNLLPKDRVKKVVAGGNHALALTESGKVYSWGVRELGQLGRFSCRERRMKKSDEMELVLTPKDISECMKKKKDVVVVDVAAGQSHSFCIMSDGSVLGFGSNMSGQLGLDDLELKPFPEEVVSLRDNNIVQIDAGDGHSLFLSKDGKIYGAGTGINGILGRGSEENTVDEETGENELAVCDFSESCKGTYTRESSVEPVYISANAQVSYTVSKNSVPYAWGFGDNNQLGNGMSNAQVQELLDKNMEATEANLLTPTILKAKALVHRKISVISAGAQHAALVAYPHTVEDM